MSNVLARAILASAARTATASTADLTAEGDARGAQIILDVTATPNNSETLTLSIEAKDPISGKYVAYSAFTALTASGLGASPTAETYIFTIYPAGAETAAISKHEVQALPLPHTWRVKATHSSSGSWTYSVWAADLR